MDNFFCPKKRQFASLFATFGKNIGFEGLAAQGGYNEKGKKI